MDLFLPFFPASRKTWEDDDDVRNSVRQQRATGSYWLNTYISFICIQIWNWILYQFCWMATTTDMKNEMDKVLTSGESFSYCQPLIKKNPSIYDSTPIVRRICFSTGVLMCLPKKTNIDSFFLQLTEKLERDRPLDNVFIGDNCIIIHLQLQLIYHNKNKK